MFGLQIMEVNNTQQIEQAVDLVIGFATFDHKLTKRISQQLKLNQNTEFLEQQEWQLFKFKLKRHQGKSIFSYMKQARCKRLNICQIESPPLIKQILHANYTNLTSLKFLDTGIYNIEIIAFLNLPVLKYFGILFCEINNTKSLVKTNWPSIQTILLRQENAKISVGKQALSRMKTGDQLKSFGFGFGNGNFLVLSKIMAKELQLFQYFETRFDHGNEIAFEKLIKLRYPKIKVRTLLVSQK